MPAIAGRATVIIFGDHPSFRWPPVPVETVECLCQAPGGPGEGERARRGLVAWWHRRIAGQAADADHAIGLLIEGGDILIADRPVRLQAVLVMLAEIRGTVTRPDGAIDIGRAADTVPHQDL
jgi:hypothetical protein